MVRFVDAEHFLKEYDQSLKKGHLYLRSKRAFQVGTKLPIKIEAPGVGFSLSLETRVLLSQEGFVGLEALSFREKVLPTLELMAQEAKGANGSAASGRGGAEPVEGEEDSAAKTMVGPLPSVIDAQAKRRPPPRDSTVIEAQPPKGMSPEASSDSPLHGEEEPTFDGLPAAIATQEEEAAVDPAERDEYLDFSGDEADVSALFELEHGIARVSAPGLYRPADAGELWGRYLAELRYGQLSCVGGPSGEVGEEVRIEILLGEDTQLLEGTIIARAGEWRMLHIAETEPVKLLLEPHRAALERLVHRTLGGSTRSASAEPARSIPNVPSRPSITPPPVAARPVTPPPPPPTPEPEVPETPEGPPRPARLEGDVVVFDQRVDLLHEIDTNLKNGGLFVDSPPLPIRTHKTLRFRVRGRELEVAIEADVVFASGGKLGFSIPAFADAVAKLKAALDRRPAAAPASTPSVAPSVPPSTRPSEAPPPSLPPAPSDAALQEGILGLAGRLSPPLHRGDLLDLFERRIKHPAGLGHLPSLLLFEYLARHNLKGILELESGSQKKRVWLHNGSIAFVESQPWTEETSLGRILIQHKLIGEPALREGLERSRATGRSLGRVLTSLGHVKAKDLTQSLREQSRLKLDSAFSWPDGSFRWLAWDNPPTKADLVLVNGMGTVGRHIKALFEQTTAADMEQLLENCMPRRIFVTEDFDRLSTKLALNQKELRFVEVHIDGQQTVADALKGSPLGRLASMRLLAFGLAMELFALERSSTGSVVRKAPTRSVTDTSGARALKQRLETDLERIKRQNHFEILGVHWTAHHRSYRSAFTQAIAQYDTSKPPISTASDEVKSLAKTLVGKIEESFKYLADANTRAAYRRKLYDQSERAFTADMLIKQGEVMMMRGDRMGSIEAMETAVELSPTDRNKEFLARARAGRKDI